MCYHSKLVANKKYMANKKNGGIVPPLPLVKVDGKMIPDERVKWVAVSCGKCMACMKKKSREWSIRLQEEIKTERNGLVVALTFSDESIYQIANGLDTEGKEIIERKTKKPIGKINLQGYDLDNEIATIAVRRFTERWRKKYGKSVRHWLITELGHQGTENIHMHGFIWTGIENKIEARKEIEEIWKYGFIYPQEKDLHKNNVSERAINYNVKYINKIDRDHTEYKPKVLTSAGIGAKYLERSEAKNNKYKPKGKTNEIYRTTQGRRIGLTTYYRNNIYTEEEKEKLWQEKLDKKIKYIGGEKINVATEEGEKIYYKLLKYYQQKSREMGYGNGDKNWDLKRYQDSQRNLKHKQRIWRANKKEGEQADKEKKEIAKNRYNRTKEKLKLRDIKWEAEETIWKDIEP